MKHLIKNKDGSIGIMDTVLDETDPSDEIKKWKEDKQAKVESHRPLVDGELPASQAFNNARRHKDDKVYIDMAEALKIHQDKLRKLREPKLAALDVEFTKAQGKKNEALADEVEAKRQALRDAVVDPIVLNASTPEELEAAIPSILK